MPELPEVETIRRSLTPHIVGKTISSIEILSPKQFRGTRENVVGKTIIALHRKGKVCAIELTGGTYLSIHLKMSGQLIFNKPPIRATRIIIHFTDSTKLLFNDIRMFGWVSLNEKPLFPKGHDVLSQEFTVQYFERMVRATKKSIKILLMDQEKLAGIGNIYANDALYLARVHPARSATSLRTSEIQKLFTAIKEVITEGVKQRGSSRENGIYRLPDGTKGGYQNFFKVYAREGKTCPACKSIIKRVAIGSRSSFYCPVCQK